MTLIPPLARREPERYPSTSFGNTVRFQAPCPCGSGVSWWISTRAETALAKPEYDIRCRHKEKQA